MPFFRESSRPRDWIHISHIWISKWVLYHLCHLGSPIQLHLVLFSHSIVPDSWRCHGLQHIMLPEVHHHLLEFAQTHVHWVSDAIQLSHPLLSPSPSSLNPSQHQDLFQWVSSLHQVMKALKLQLQHQSFQWILWVDFLRIDWFDLLAGQGTLKSLLQHHSLKASTLQCSAFFMSSSHIHTWLPEKS